MGTVTGQSAAWKEHIESTNQFEKNQILDFQKLPGKELPVPVTREFKVVSVMKSPIQKSGKKLKLEGNERMRTADAAK